MSDRKKTPPEILKAAVAAGMARQMHGLDW